jgi:S-adenosylmethionine:tRNA ribosyltransferase-isomerase
MTLDRTAGRREHRVVEELPEILSGPAFHRGGPPLLVFNNSKVRRAKITGAAKSGGASSPAEFLLLNRVDSLTWRAMAKRAKRRRGNLYRFGDNVEGEIVEIAGTAGEARTGITGLRFNRPIDDSWLDIHGRVPLPPYIKRGIPGGGFGAGGKDESADSGRYQTVYADASAGADLGPGASAAAPTAGLHFTEELLARLEGAGIEGVFVTLHVGLGTFLPVRTENVEDHVMHEEAYCIGGDAARRINAARAGGRRIVAVGTTSLRTLEAAWRPGDHPENGGPPGAAEGFIPAGEGATSIFIYPGRRFRVADALFTNFHTPGSTLLMLAAAFAGAGTGVPAGEARRPGGGAFPAGLALILESYAEAAREGYRFFSYGDAMLIY